MHLRRGQFQWPWQCVDAIQSEHDQGSARASINTTIMQHVPTLLAILMAIAMLQYYTMRIARWRRFVAFIKATKRHHGVSTCSDINQPDMPTLVVSDISS